MPEGIVTIKAGREKPIRQQHPWIFSGAIASAKNAGPGEIVTVVSHTGEFLARGYWNPKSQIQVRILTWQDEPIDEAWWRRMLQRAIDGRALQNFMQEDDQGDEIRKSIGYRLINAENDFLPGLVVDRYADYLVVQALTLGIDQRKKMIAEQLASLLKVKGVYERSDVDVRAKEGLSFQTGRLWGDEPPELIDIYENGLQIKVDVRSGHKTGYYLDQAANRQLLHNLLSWGVATAGSGLLLTDTRKNFTTMGVKAGDLIVNAGDGSYGRVSAVTANTLTVSELIMGAVNVFNAGDNYFLPRYNTDGASREGLLSFHERGQPFKTGFDVDWSLLESNGIVIQTVPDVTGGAQTGYLTKVKADIQSSASTYSVGVNDGTCVWMDENYIECNGKTDIADMSVGGVVTSGFNTSTVTDSSQSFITGGVKRGDLIQNFNDETDLSMSRNVDSGSCGTARTGSNNLTLKDTMNNFLDIGVAAGDTVTNKTDGSSGTIQTVAANQLTVVSLSGGTSNVFTTGDSYEISGGPRLYDNGANLLNYIQDGPYELMVRNNTTGLQGVVTEIVDNNTLVAASYPNSAAICFSKGDSYKIRVPQYMAVNTVSSATSLTTAQLSSPAPDFDTGEYYRIKSAAKKFPAGDGIYDDVDGINFSGTRFTEFGDDLVALGVEKGDVVRNITNNNAYGKITDIYVSGGNTYVTATLYGGYWWRNSFATNDLYEIYYNYVDSRELQFRVRFNGGTASPLGRNVYAVAGIRKRSDCIGYGSDCSAAAGAGSVPYNFGIPVITLTDYEDDLDVAATTTSTIPNAGSPTGNIRVSNIDYYLAEGGNELPEWFVHNKWYQFVYAAYSSGFRPGAAGSCTAGGNCLSVSLPYPVPAGTIYNDRHSVVLTAGRELASQNRAAAAIADYFEGQNASASDDSFVKGEISSSFNDQISVVCPDPLNTDCP